MEGIITGIGDKELGKNLIKPEYDAVINDFIIGKNTILEGLVLNGNNLSAGTCILCGYRGIIEASKTLDTTAYVYGEFILNFDTEIEDSFNIVTSTSALTTNVNPTEITSAGTYYLLLYENGVGKIDREHRYPLNSQYSVETEKVVDGAVIAPTATTPTEIKTNVLGWTEIVTDLHLTQPKRVANTEYVHAQITREIDYGREEVTFYYPGTTNTLGSMTLERKAKYVVATYTYNPDGSYFAGTNLTMATLPEGFIPTEDVEFFMGEMVVKLTTSGLMTNSTIPTTIIGSGGKYVFGYKCQ